MLGISKGNAELKKIEKKRKELKDRETKVSSLEERYTKGVGKFFSTEYISLVYDYIYQKKPASLTILSVVDPVDELNQKLEAVFVGLWYGVKIMDKEKTILKIPTFDLQGDACAVNEHATKKRNSQLLLGTMLAQYFKVALEFELEENHLACEIEVVQNINVGKSLFTGELDGSEQAMFEGMKKKYDAYKPKLPPELIAEINKAQETHEQEEAQEETAITKSEDLITLL